MIRPFNFSAGAACLKRCWRRQAAAKMPGWHSSGMRASIYRAMPTEGVQALANYMREFERDSA